MKTSFSDNTAQPLLELRGISKSFLGVQALQHIDLKLYPGEIFGLIGDNGAGKSTLIKILSGIHKPDGGQLFLRGKEINLAKYTVRQARLHGIETVFQDRSMGEKQTLWRNTFLGRPLVNRLGFINVKKQKRETHKILKNYVGLKSNGISPNAQVQNLSGGERQGLAIGRAMYFDSDIVILDEPTTALSLHEVNKVLTFINSITKQNKACIYISHNMDHMHKLAHRIALLEKGCITKHFIKDNISQAELAASLMGIQQNTAHSETC